MGDKEYVERIAEINAAIRRLEPQVDASLIKAKARLAAMQDFPWQATTPVARAGVLQEVFEALFVDPVTNSIIAVAPKPELRPFLGERAWIKKVATGWVLFLTGLPTGNM